MSSRITPPRMAEAKAKAAPPPPQEIVDLESEDFAWRCSMASTLSGRGATKQEPIIVEQYVEELDLKRAIASTLSSSAALPTFVDLSSCDRHVVHLDDSDEEDVILSMKLRRPGETSRSQRKKRRFSEIPVTETGQSSNSKGRPPPFVCDICAESKDADDLFQVQGCVHSYCSECMGRYVASKLQENITSIKCPEAGCCGRLEPHHCRSILPQEVFDRWGRALCEALILGTEKFYCPFRDCSVMLINDGSVIVKESECPYCHRLFCAQCQVPWHGNVSCEDFQKLNKDEREREDIMLKKLAQEMKWMRCPKCNFYVQKVDGCMFVKCRCGVEFCYVCGSQTKTSHYCANCRH